VKFPGGKLLHGWDLALQRLSLDDLLRSCRQVSLTGTAEIQLSSGAGMILFYKGSETSVVFREGGSGHQGGAAIERLRAAMAEDEGTIAVYELPLEMAHLLRGLTNRRRERHPVARPADLTKLLESLRHREHTGMIEVQTASGSAALLLVQGRMSNLYWEGTDGRTLEKEPGLLGLHEALLGDEAVVFVSDFSRDVWKARREVSEGPGAIDGAEAELAPLPSADRESQLRSELLRDLDEQVPAMVQALVFDLMTRAILTRRIRGTSALASMQLADRIPDFTAPIREAHAADGDDIDFVRIEAGQSATLIALVHRTAECVALVIDKAQPAGQVLETLRRRIEAYAVQAAAARGLAGGRGF